MSSRLAGAIDALLPQTQCTRCGYAACRPYAEAVATGRAPINRCPPGGAGTIADLAALLAREPMPLDPTLGGAGDWTVAVVDEARCIGCKLCIQACPVDAIVGTAKRMHTVLPRECTGCGLCVPVCPMDCIDLVPMPWPATSAVEEGASGDLGPRHGRAFLDAWRVGRAPRARARYQARERRARSIEQARVLGSEGRSRRSVEAVQSVIADAVARVRARRRALDRKHATDGPRGA